MSGPSQLQLESDLLDMHHTLSRRIDWMETEFQIKFAALALQFS